MPAVVKRAVVMTSAALCVFLAFCYLVRPDGLAALTIWPVWAWPFLVFPLTALVWDRRDQRALARLGLMWALFVLLLADEAVPLARMLTRGPLPPSPPQRPGAVRVVTINCAAGSVKAIEEAARWHPDVLLVQESPSAGMLRAAARQVLGPDSTAIWGMDGSIAVRGSARPVTFPRDFRHRVTAARVSLYGGQQLTVASLRLTCANIRLDVWERKCRAEHSNNRQRRREELAAIMKMLPDRGPVLVGGDFNAPAGDAVFREFPPRMRDVFRAAGRGWGDTIVNEFPVHRIDQIWTSPELQPEAAAVCRTVHSDHRMLICDLVLRR